MGEQSAGAGTVGKAVTDMPPPAEGNAPAGLQGLQGFPLCLPDGCDPPHLWARRLAPDALLCRILQ